MGEVTRFRWLRSAERRPVGGTPAVATIKGIDASAFFGELRAAVSAGTSAHGVPPIRASGDLQQAATGFRQSARFVDPFSGQPDPALQLLIALDHALLRDESASPAERLGAFMSALSSPPGGAAYASRPGAGMDDYLLRLLESLAALLIISPTDKRARRLTRLLSIGNLLMAALDHGPLDDEELHAVLRRSPALPTPPFPLREFVTTLPRLVVRRGVADLYVVRDEWACYQAGEIAHIENAMQGEFRERIHKRLNEIETETTIERDEKTFEEQDLQTTDRTALKSEAETTTALNIGVEMSVDVSGQVGPMEIAAHVGGSLEYSREDSSKVATERARETIERAVSRVESRIHTIRRTRELQRTEETNTHRIDSPTGNVSAVYRWVDKVQRLQMFKFPHRLIFEFQVPEPAALFKWIMAAKKASEKTAEPVAEPVPFTVNGVTPGTILTAKDITAANYGDLAARYGVVGLPEPPAATISVAAAAELGSDRKAEYNNWADVPFPPRSSATLEMVVPDGYVATRLYASAIGVPELGKWLDQVDNSDDGVTAGIGYHSIHVGVTAAGKQMLLADPQATSVRATTSPGGPGYRFLDVFLRAEEHVDLPVKPTGKLSVAASLAGSFKGSVSVGLECSVLDVRVQSWQTEIFSQLAAAYGVERNRWLQSKSFTESQEEPTSLAASPPRNKIVVREELKRLIIDCLLGPGFAGIDGLTVPADPSRSPEVNRDVMAMQSEVVQFIEQAFEWHNMSYVLYPYFWGAKSRWSALEPIATTDPEFDAFLRSGSARVVISARRGLENAANAFIDFGILWGFKAPPVPGDEEYISVAQEISDLTRGSSDGEPLESWEVKLPTTLVWLDSDSAMPKTNKTNRLTAPAAPLCTPVP